MAGGAKGWSGDNREEGKGAGEEREGVGIGTKRQIKD